MFRPLRQLSLAAVLACSPSLWAADAAPLLQSLGQQQLASYKLQTLFHLLSIEEASDSLGADLKAQTRVFQERMSQLGEQAKGLGVDAEIKALQAEAARFVELVGSDELATLGYVSLHTANDLSASQAALRQACEQIEQKLGGAGGHTDPLQQQAILMQRIAAEYVRESASLDGGSAIYDNAHDLEKPVDELAREFRQQLGSLDKQFASEQAVQQRLKKVDVTFAYIEKSLQNYKERSVPYVVSRYSDKIVVNLTSAP